MVIRFYVCGLRFSLTRFSFRWIFGMCRRLIRSLSSIESDYIGYLVRLSIVTLIKVKANISLLCRVEQTFLLGGLTINHLFRYLFKMFLIKMYHFSFIVHVLIYVSHQPNSILWTKTKKLPTISKYKISKQFVNISIFIHYYLFSIVRIRVSIICSSSCILWCFSRNIIHNP